MLSFICLLFSLLFIFIVLFLRLAAKQRHAPLSAITITIPNWFLLNARLNDSTFWYGLEEANLLINNKIDNLPFGLLW
jgi:hypothetical protein